MNSTKHQIKVLALSSSKSGNYGYLEKAAPRIKNFLGDVPLNIAFIPFASVDYKYQEYYDKVQEGLSALPYTIMLVTPDNATSMISNCDVIMVGGGNTFKLLHDIYTLSLFEQIRDKVNTGAPFIGWSAGSNITGRTIATTNDMPIIEPASFRAFGFFPFQINPHYLNQTAEGFHGETRDQRLAEFILLNNNVPVIGLPEGSALLMQEGLLKFVGENEGVLFTSSENLEGWAKQQIKVGEDLSRLLYYGEKEDKL